MSVADQVKAHPAPYRRAIALMLYRRLDNDAQTVTMHFEDGSTITFQILYEVMP